METLSTKQLIALADENAIRTVAVCGTAGGFTIAINGKLIELKRGNARIFRKLQAAATFLKNNSIDEFTVNVAKWSPDQKAII